MASLTFTIEGDLRAQITVTENGAGGLIFNVQLLSHHATIGDLRALYFDVNNHSLLSGLMVSGGDVTARKFSADAVNSVNGGDTNINGEVIKEFGKFDGGVEFGTAGIGKNDIQSTTFVLTHSSASLSLDLIALQDFAVRITSVGEEDGLRDDSLKLGATAPDVSSSNLIVGDDHPNNLIGTAGTDIIQALGADDLLQGLGGDDQLFGGQGFDRAVYSDATGPISVNMATGTVTGAGSGNDTLSEIEGVVGSNFDDIYDAANFAGVTGIPGSPIGINEFEGRAGNDLILGNLLGGFPWTQISYVSATAGVSVDFLTGFATGDASVGTDTFTNVSQVVGSNFDDILLGGSSPPFSREVFDGRGGDDFINGRGGLDIAAYNTDPAVSSGIFVDLDAGIVTGDASVGTDTLRSVEGVRGTQFADTFDATGFGGGSTNAGSGGTQNEFEGFGGDDVIIGNGNTRISYSFAGSGVTVDLQAGLVLGDASIGTDVFTGVSAVAGSTFDDTLFGTNGNNQFIGLAGNDFIDGRGGSSDLAIYVSQGLTTAGITVDLANGIVTGDASIGTDTLRSIEMVLGTNFDDLFDATGFGGSSLNAGSNGTFNQFEGAGGDDLIIGNGFTVAAYLNANGGVSVDLASGIATGNASVGTDTLVNVTRIAGSNFDDILIGNGASNIIDARGGNDFIDGGDNTGGGSGRGDRVDYQASTGAIFVQLADGIVTGNASVGTDTLRSVEGAIGSSFDDVWDATGFSDSSLNAGSVGSDVFAPNGQFNQFEGVAGNDLIIGNGFTELNYFGATGGVFVDFVAGTATGNSSVGTDTFTGVNAVGASAFNDTIIGDDNNNVLVGRGGGDTIYGGAGTDLIFGDVETIPVSAHGDDFIRGGEGTDNIITGGGNDTIFFATGDGLDFIQDFVAGEGSDDVFDLSGVDAVSSFAEVMAFATDNGTDTTIDFGGGDSIVIRNVLTSMLHSDDFSF